MKKPAISVLIPVYNAEKYIADCLQSIRQQFFTDFEIICVNDGSTDHSAKIIEQMMLQEPRLRLITQPNQGVAVTRNRLVQEARGEYVAFVDADDKITLDYLVKLYQQAQVSQADITKCFFVELTEDGTQYMSAHCSHLFYQQPTAQLGSRFTCGYYNSVVWGKLFRRDFLQKNHLSFYRQRIAEDLPFVVLAFLYANHVAIVPEPLYIYRKGMTTCITANSEKMIVDELRNVLDLSTELKIRSLFTPAVQTKWVRAIVWRICAFRKVNPRRRANEDKLLKTAFYTASKVVKQGSLYLKLRWGLLFLLVKISGWKRVFLWTKIFR